MRAAIYHRLCPSPQAHLAIALSSFLECRDAAKLDETEEFIEPIAAAVTTGHLRSASMIHRGVTTPPPFSLL